MALTSWNLPLKKKKKWWFWTNTVCNRYINSGSSIYLLYQPLVYFNRRGENVYRWAHVKSKCNNISWYSLYDLSVSHTPFHKGCEVVLWLQSQQDSPPWICPVRIFWGENVNKCSWWFLFPIKFENLELSKTTMPLK